LTVNITKLPAENIWKEWRSMQQNGKNMKTLFAQTYEIRTINDLFRVPIDRRAEMIRDLLAWMNSVDNNVNLNCDVFTWIDDGIPGIGSLQLVGTDGNIFINLVEDTEK
jgi:hypothetical protein